MKHLPNLIELRDLIQTCAEQFRKYERDRRAEVAGIVEYARATPSYVEVDSDLTDILAKADMDRLLAESCEAMLKRFPDRSEIQFISPERIILTLNYLGHNLVAEGSPEGGGEWGALEYLSEGFIKDIRDMIARKSFSPPRIHHSKTGAQVDAETLRSKPSVDVRELVAGLPKWPGGKVDPSGGQTR